MNDFITIRPSLPEQVATLARDNSSKRNALYPEMRVGIARVAAHLRRNRDIRACIVTGASGHFCWGGDLRNIATVGLDNEGFTSCSIPIRFVLCPSPWAFSVPKS